MVVLVTGGAGYIGSVTVDLLVREGTSVVVLDDLSRGHPEALAPHIPLRKASVGDPQAVKRIVEEYGIDACIHFAALAYVGESVARPLLYFENNVSQGTRLIASLIEAGVRHFVFSSTCAIYGEPTVLPISEGQPQRPVNPYGWSKLAIERLLDACDNAYGLKFVALRYFNAAGATPEHGEDHDPETHLIPNVLSAAQGSLPSLHVFGTDYSTPDGTAVRDYIHVSDLAAAHISALGHLIGGGSSEVFNLGTGQGHSILEVVEAVRKVTGRRIDIVAEPRRRGDPPSLVADSSRARRVLKWEPRHSSLEEIVRSAWDWRRSHPDGYGKR